VGKTKLLYRMVNDKYTQQYKATIGADFLTKEVIHDHSITMQMWDTAGQERFQSLGVAFYRGSDVAVLCFSVDSRASFEALENWQAEFETHASPRTPEEFPYLVVGLQSDVTPRAVASETAKAWVAKKGKNYQYLEASSKLGEGVKEVLEALYEASTRSIVKEEPIFTPPLLLEETPAEEKESPPKHPVEEALEEAFKPLITSFKELDEEHHIVEKVTEFVAKATTELEAGFKIVEEETLKVLGQVAEDPVVKEGLEKAEAWTKATGDQLNDLFGGASRWRLNEYPCPWIL